MRKLVSIIIILLLFITTLVVDTSIAYANNDYCINSSSYTGTYDSSTPNNTGDGSVYQI